MIDTTTDGSLWKFAERYLGPCTIARQEFDILQLDTYYEVRLANGHRYGITLRDLMQNPAWPNATGFDGSFKSWVIDIWFHVEKMKNVVWC